MDAYKQLIDSNGHIDFDSLVDIEDQLPEEMWQLLDRGFTVGIFQIEDGGTPKDLCKKIRPRSLEDVALITALNRPGVLNSGGHNKYVKHRNGEPVVYRHPIFEVVAQESYGVLVYQEQFINFFRELGYDAKEADSIRAIVGKKKRKEMAEIKPDYLKRFMAHPGTDMDDAARLTWRTNPNPALTLAEQFWAELENFADYAFNKAHSLEYGLITLWTTFAKWYNPQSFYLGSMQSLVKQGKKEHIPRYVREAQRMGIKILGPDLNRSKAGSSVDDGAIRYGFADVKGIGLAPAKWLVENGPFKDFEDLEEKSQEDARKITLKNGMRKKGIHAGQITALRRLASEEGWALAETQEELLGLALTDPSLEILLEYKDEIQNDCTPVDQIDEYGTHSIAGIITNIKLTKTKNGDPMAWVTIDYEGEQRDYTVWNRELERLSFIWRRRQAVAAQIKVNEKGANIITAKALYSKRKAYES